MHPGAAFRRRGAPAAPAASRLRPPLMRLEIEMGRRRLERGKHIAGIFILAWGMVLGCTVRHAEAFQIHPASEGLWAHQIAHLFFLLSMGGLIYWLRARNLVRETGWRRIQYAALLFILWNIDAMFVHYLDGRHDLFTIINVGAWHGWVGLAAAPEGLGFLYYAGKMDHLLLLPAIVFLYSGLGRLLEAARASGQGEESS